MSVESENNKKLKDFFSEEYQSLRAYANSKIEATVNRDAEDIIQDVALKLFTRANTYSPINNVAGFVYNTIRNTIIDIMRSDKRSGKRTEFFDDKLQEFVGQIYEAPKNQYSEELIVGLKQTINELKPIYRDIIIAVDFEGYTYKEISLETGIPTGTLMSHRHRALAILHKQLETKKLIKT